MTGVVTYNGVPVAGAAVVFSPPSGGKPASGITDEQGHYILSTFKDKDGAVPGDYQVSVAKSQTDGPTMTDEERYKYIEEHGGANPPEPESKNLLPEKYLSPATSDLKATVKPGNNDIPLTLAD
ncbi:MAG: hypothetical protein B7Z73_16840 [Planctomycetia bacterium 21-64-5]|nr:MAG: hypothetical protein B7Z73_16840 [Planctomycetia bacterium 21-64-5]